MKQNFPPRGTFMNIFTNSATSTFRGWKIFAQFPNIHQRSCTVSSVSSLHILAHYSISLRHSVVLQLGIPVKMADSLILGNHAQITSCHWLEFNVRCCWMQCDMSWSVLVLIDVQVQCCLRLREPIRWSFWNF
jgi:hypothetical protein